MERRRSDDDGGRRRRLVGRTAVGAAFLVGIAVVPVLLVRDDGSDPGARPADGGRSTVTARSTPIPLPAVPRPSPSPSLSPSPSRSPSGPVPPAPAASPPPRTSYQEFVSLCAPAGVAGTGAAATVSFGAGPGSASGSTSCVNAADGSTYAVPALLSGGAVLDPDRAEIYYKSAVRDYRTVTAPPPGLRLRSDPLGETAADGRTGSWDCGDRSGPQLPADCPAGADLVLRVQAPSCWDGRRLDSPDRSHVSWPVGDRCPGGHPVPVPMVEVKVIYRLPGGPLDLRLATGPGDGLIFGYVNGWQPAPLEVLVADCLHRGRRCDESGVDPAVP